MAGSPLGQGRPKLTEEGLWLNLGAPSPTLSVGEEMPWGCFSCVELTHLSPFFPTWGPWQPQ